MAPATCFLHLRAHSSISLSIPAKDLELSTEAGSSAPLCRQIQFDQGYYWCHIVHQHQPDQGSEAEFCIALICDKEGEPDLDYYLLAENTPHNGPLMLIPGSHRTFLTCVGETPEDHYRQSLKRQEYGVPDQDSLAELAHKHGIVAPTGKPGSVVIFDCNIMHGSNGNITPFPRANAFIVYNAVSNALEAPFGVEKPRPQFIAARGAPEELVPVAGALVGEVMV